MADFVVYVVVAAPVKPDLIGQPVFHFLFEVALFQTLPALFLQAQAVPQVVQKFLNYICRPFFVPRSPPPDEFSLIVKQDRHLLLLGKPHGPPEHGEGKLGKGLSVILGVFRDVCLAVLSI